MERPLSPLERTLLLALARTAIQDHFHDDGSLDRFVPTMKITPPLEEPRGAFVTIRESVAKGRTGTGRLRGCIGTVEPQEALYRCVIQNAVRGAFEDPRFPPLQPSELPRLTIEISALTPLQEVRRPEEIVPGRDGVHLEQGSNRAIFLPQVATEQGWGTQELLENLALKAGLAQHGWKEANLLVFQAEVFGDGAPPRPESGS